MPAALMELEQLRQSLRDEAVRLGGDGVVLDISESKDFQLMKSVVREGDGAHPPSGASHVVRVHYTGRLMTGETFDGRKAAEMRLVNSAVPADKLREATIKLATTLMEKNPTVLAYTKQAMKTARHLNHNDALEYLLAKGTALRFADQSGTRDAGIRKFIDEKTFRPGMEAIKGEDE